MSVLEKTAPEVAPVEAPPRDDRVTTITPATRLPKLDLRELWHYRELALTFVWRDLKVRYKQTFIGILWVVLQPLLATGIFTLIFGRFAEFPSDDVPYPIFVFAGVIMWTTYFQPAFNSASGSIAGNKSLITKVYFPRVLLPLGAVVTPLVDFVIVFPILVAMIVLVRRRPDRAGAAVPALRAAGARHRACRRAALHRGRRALPRRAVRRSRS